MIKEDYAIAVSAEEMLASNRSAKKFEKVIQRACEEGASLLKPKSAVKYYNIANVGNDGVVTLADEAGEYQLSIGPQAGYLSPASELLVCVNTVGSELTDKIEEYDKNGETLLAYYLDVYGVRAITAVTAEIRRMAEERATQRHLGVGPILQPGSVENWTVAGQRDLFELSEATEIGLVLTQGSMLRPRISDSMIIGIGNYTSKLAASLCPECPRYRTCLWRRENQGA